MSSSTYPILIVEDDSDLSELIKIQLTDNDYEAEQALNGRVALNKALENKYSLIILDIMLPEVDGFEICKSIRKENHQVPILMLTAKAEEVDKIMGLEFGADDYLTKPFSIKELIARVKALLRRASASETEDSSKLDQMDFGDLVIYPNKRSVQLGDELIELTSKEFELLLLFAKNPGRAYSRQELLDVVWGYQYSGYSHTVNSHINRLRSKIEKNPSEPKYITTVWGMGYKFAELEELGIQ
ncbi:MAG: response regulator transcription factor [Balneola sp.]|nr:response regulator transcription factor [Balneola sp.]MBO6650761.1 response regulator transcription factor [Balneola sp.]MBO6710674.1 response regulator transcription factor [Balneola sp.]MBO6799360.1 response regulator transcription factor [Balneola sp.]MBO6869511.1 response regulator transcription factor [Balneola sp.]